jgi:hypothetical protein
MAIEIRPLFRPPRKTIITLDPESLSRRIAELLARVRQERYEATIKHKDKIAPKQRTTAQQIATWAGSIKNFASHKLREERELDSYQDALKLIYHVVSWYADHWQDSPYIPDVQSAMSLRRKFERLEAAQQRMTPKTNGHHHMSLAEVLNKSGIPVSRTAAFTKDLLTPAKRLTLFDLEDEIALASALAQLYAQVKEARDAAMLPGPLRGRLGGPFEIVRRYIGWLEEQHWRASSRVLQLSSPAFAQYRRDTQDQEGFDPIDGRTH